MTDQSTHSPRTPFRRATTNRVWAGVAASIATRLDVAPGLVRAGFVFASFFGGIGFLLYIAGWILIPAEGESDALLERWIRDGDGINWVGLALIGIAVLSLPLGFGASTLFDTHSAFPTLTLLAVGLLVIGVLLYRGTFDDHGPRPPDAGQELLDGADGSADEQPEDPSVQVESDHSTEQTEDSGAEPGTEVDEDVDKAILTAAYESPGPDRPTNDGPQNDANRSVRPRSILGRAIIAASLVVVGLMAIVDNWWLSIGAAQYFAAALVVIGIGLLIGAWRGRARVTIFLGIPLFFLLQLSSIFHVPLTGGFGDPMYSPLTIDQLQSEYRLSAGEMGLDLRELVFEGEQLVVASIGAGELTVLLPNDVDAIITADAVAGEVEIQGRFESGPYISLDREIRVDSPRGTIVLDLDVIFGLITVAVEPPNSDLDSGGS